MPLLTTVNINEDTIAKIRVERIATNTEGWHQYLWTVDRVRSYHPTPMGVDTRSEVTGTLVHQYDDGALKLLTSVLEAYYRNVAEYEFEHKHEGGGY